MLVEELRNFLIELENKMKNDEISEQELFLIFEFFCKFKFLKNESHDRKDLIKYCALGYHIYSTIENNTNL